VRLDHPFAPVVRALRGVDGQNPGIPMGLDPNRRADFSEIGLEVGLQLDETHWGGIRRRSFTCGSVIAPVAAQFSTLQFLAARPTSIRWLYVSVPVRVSVASAALLLAGTSVGDIAWENTAPVVPIALKRFSNQAALFAIAPLPAGVVDCSNWGWFLNPDGPFDGAANVNASLLTIQADTANVGLSVSLGWWEAPLGAQRGSSEQNVG
jgi:hypothetical protein